MAEGIRKRHSKGCSAREGGRCNCKAGWEASVYLAREGASCGHKLPPGVGSEVVARDALAEAARPGSLRSPSRRSPWSRRPGSGWRRRAPGRSRDRSGHHYKPSTLREYGAPVRCACLPKFGASAWPSLTRADLQGFVDELLAEGSRRARSATPSTRSRRSIAMPCATNWSPSTRRAKSICRRTRPARADRHPERSRALLAALPDADRPIWATAFYAGLRRGELQALRVCDIDLERTGSPSSAPGTRTRARSSRSRAPEFGLCRFWPCCATTLRPSTLASGDDLVFGRRAALAVYPDGHRRTLQARLGGRERHEREAALRGARARPAAPISLHVCRHTFASLLIDAGVNPRRSRSSWATAPSRRPSLATAI